MADTIEISEARQKFNQLATSLKGKGRHVLRVTRHGKEVLAIVDIDYLDSLLETIDILADPEAMRSLEASFEDIKAGRLRNWEEIKDEVF